MTTPAQEELRKRRMLQTQIEIGKGVLPDTRTVTVRLLGAVYDVLEGIAKEEGAHVSQVAANVLSGWVCQVQDEFDAQGQKTDRQI